ncbi:hypothetical protein OR1_04201 [Geobacter sp. OR-1]|nr:hypothetical protein OR1_04201 [Geobacter sp. OR-1]
MQKTISHSMNLTLIPTALTQKEAGLAFMDMFTMHSSPKTHMT